MKSLLFCKSSGVVIGFLEKNRIQPASVQKSTTKPAFSMRFSSVGCSFAPM